MSSELEVYYQQLGPEHKAGMIAICKECFPVNYPEQWFDNLLKKSPNTYAHGAFDKVTHRMIGMIVGQTQNIFDAEDEVGTLLESVVSDQDTVLYITIFGVSESHRRLGIGSSLMQRLLYHAETQKDTRVVYLHVESTNNVAISFYERFGFHYFTEIPGYYHLEGSAADGLVYVIYMNGGSPYQGGFRNWYKRYVRQGSIGQCFGRAYENSVELIKNAFQRQNSSIF